MTTNRPANVETYFVQFWRSINNAFIFDGFLFLFWAGTDTHFESYTLCGESFLSSNLQNKKPEPLTMLFLNKNVLFLAFLKTLTLKDD